MTQAKPTRHVAYDVGLHLAGLGLVEFPSQGGEWSLFVGKLPDSPDNALVVVPTGGNPVLGSSALPYDEPTVQVLVRGSDFAGAYSKAAQVYGALQGHSGQLGDVEVVLCYSGQTDAVWIGQDDAGRDEFTLNFALHMQAATTNRQ